MPHSDSTGREGRDPDAEIAVPGDTGRPDVGPSDVFLDVPALHVDKLELEVDDLEAHVSLKAEVLDLLKLNVGADVRLGSVQLDLEGVDVQAQLKVRLHHIAAIVTRLLATVDRNPQILEQLTRGVGSAVEDLGAGTGRAAGELGEGAGAAVSEVGRGAGTAVESLGAGTGTAVEGGDAAGSAAEDVGRDAADVVGEDEEADEEDEAEEPRRPAARRRRRAPERSAEPDRPRRTAPAKAKKASRSRSAEESEPPARKPVAKKKKKTAAGKTVTKKATGRPRHRA